MNQPSPTPQPAAERLYPAETLRDLTVRLCRAMGSEEGEAALVGRHLINGNLAGHDSHGIGLMPIYVDEVLEKKIFVNRHVRVVADRGAVLQLDGQAGFGQVIGGEAMTLGIARAREFGVAVVALTNTHHLARIGTWGEQCADAGMISIHYVNVHGHPPLVAPFGGRDACYSTNPYCTAIPATDRHPRLILDMATSMVAMGKVRVANNRGVPMPEGCLIDPDGRATNDPGVMYREPRGALLPFGGQVAGHKGYGLALICELLAGALTGGGTNQHDRTSLRIINNMLTIIIDPAAVGDVDSFRRDLDEVTDTVKASRPSEASDGVMVPGDPERRMREKRLAEGIPIDANTWSELMAAARRVGLNEVALAAPEG